jgi:cellulose synthase (UDP-forming)
LQGGDRVSVFVKEVGFIAGTVVRYSQHLLAVRFELPPSLERDLLIRKLFTAGLDTLGVDISAWSSTGAIFRSIWTTRTELSGGVDPASAAPVETPVHKLPAQSLVVQPRPRTTRLSDLAQGRQRAA